MNCKVCESDRIASVSSKASDLSVFQYHNIEHDGYLPDDVGIGGGDYCEFDYCLDCGMIQADFPISDETICESLELDELPNFVDTSTLEKKIERFGDLHEDAEKDLEGMPELEWKEYRRLGSELVNATVLEESMIIK